MMVALSAEEQEAAGLIAGGVKRRMKDDDGPAREIDLGGND